MFSFIAEVMITNYKKKKITGNSPHHEIPKRCFFALLQIQQPFTYQIRKHEVGNPKCSSVSHLLTPHGHCQESSG